MSPVLPAHREIMRLDMTKMQAESFLEIAHERMVLANLLGNLAHHVDVFRPTTEISRQDQGDGTGDMYAHRVSQLPADEFEELPHALGFGFVHDASPQRRESDFVEFFVANGVDLFPERALRQPAVRFLGAPK